MAVINFKETPDAYAKGRPVNMESWNGITREFETDAQLGFGVPVARGANDHGCVAYTGSNEFIGVSAADLVLPHPGDYYVQYESVGIYNRVTVGVDVGDNTVEDGSLAAFNTVDGVWQEPDTTYDAVPGCQFETSGTGIVALRVNVPIPSA